MSDVLFVSERHHRFDARGGAGRDIARGERDSGERHRGRRQRRRVAWLERKSSWAAIRLP